MHFVLIKGSNFEQWKCQDAIFIASFIIAYTFLIDLIKCNAIIKQTIKLNKTAVQCIFF